MPKKAHTSLMHIIRKSLEDYTFFQGIKKDIEKTLKTENMSLKKKDLKLLKEMLAEKHTLTGREFIEVSHFIKDGRITKKFPVWGGIGQILGK